jgi:MFS family permease
MDRFGRRWTVLIGAAINLLGAALQTGARNLAMILVGRILAGWAVGVMSMSVPIYQSECAHPKTRGTTFRHSNPKTSSHNNFLLGLIVGLTQEMIGIGFIVSTWVGYGSSKVPHTSSFSWRFPLGFQCIPCIIIICGILFFPESPRYLMETDRSEEALRVLRKLHYHGSNDDWIQSEFNEIKLTIEAEKAITAPGWMIMFTVKPWRKRLMHATLVQVFTQMTGCVPFDFLSPSCASSLSLAFRYANTNSVSMS